MVSWINKIIDKDAAFLFKHHLIDYSMLIKVEKLSANYTRMPKESRNIHISEDRHKVYHFGIIDYLQNYSNKKHL